MKTCRYQVQWKYYSEEDEFTIIHSRRCLYSNLCLLILHENEYDDGSLLVAKAGVKHLHGVFATDFR